MGNIVTINPINAIDKMLDVDTYTEVRITVVTEFKAHTIPMALLATMARPTTDTQYLLINDKLKI